MEFATIRNVVHCVFDTEKEFEDYCISSGINPIPKIVPEWRDAEELEWTLGDDGRIVQILKVGHFNKHNKKSKYVRTVVGTFHTENCTVMDTDFSQHPNRYMMSKNSIRHRDSVKTRTKLTVSEELWAAEIIVLGKKPWDAYYEVFKTKSMNQCKKSAALLLKQERIIKFMDKLVTDAANELGLDHGWVLSNYKSIAEESKSENTRLAAVDRVSEVIGTAGEKQKETRQVAAFSGFGGEALDVLGMGSRREAIEAAVIEDTPA